MPCYHPIKAWVGVNSKTGNKKLYFKRPKIGTYPTEINVPCNKCMGCRIIKKQEYALRMRLEEQMHNENCFLTLTYDPEFIPENGSINKRELQLFLKKLRRKFTPKNPHKVDTEEHQLFTEKHKIGYFAVGEYGENGTQRPHYHLCLFNLNFPDKQKHSFNKKGEYWLYTSETLDKIWKKGFSQIGDFTKETANYVAHYTTKKIGGEESEKHYEHINQETGEVSQREPEFSLQSQKPAIGRSWYNKFKADCNKDYLVVQGHNCTVPNYFDKLIKEEKAEQHYNTRLKRKDQAQLHQADSTPERLAVREKIKLDKFNQFKRDKL